MQRFGKDLEDEYKRKQKKVEGGQIFRESKESRREKRSDLWLEFLFFSSL